MCVTNSTSGLYFGTKNLAGTQLVTTWDTESPIALGLD